MIHRALQMVIQKELSSVIIESDSSNGETRPPNHICNLVEDIVTLTRAVDNIKFLYCYRSANELADKIARKTLMYCKQGVVCNK